MDESSLVENESVVVDTDQQQEQHQKLDDQPESQKQNIEKEEFNNWLMNKISRQSTMISRTHGEKIIQFLRDKREKGDSSELRSKYTAPFRFQVKKRQFKLINVVGLGDILCMPVKDKAKSCHAMLGQHRQVIFKEDMFDVIDNAHKNGKKHRGYKGTFKKISATYCNIPREIVHKYVRMCRFCQKTHACYVPSKGTKKKKDLAVPVKKKWQEIEMTFLTRCQVDILDMGTSPDLDGQFSAIGHFVDHHTKYNVLFPLKRSDSFYVAKKLCRYVFGHFGLPRILHSNMGRKYLDELITWLLQLWSTDAQILNGNPRYKRMNSLIQQRQKTIMILIESIRAKQSDASSWSVWLPGIQYSLNTNQFEPGTPPAYDAVFNRRPHVYSYSPSTREIPREEDFHDLDEDTTEQNNNINEVITVSMSEIMNTGSDSILISQMNQNMTVLDETKTTLDQRQLKDTNAVFTTADLLNSSNLTSLPIAIGDQYTIIGSTLGVSGHTLQIPIVDLGNNTLSIAGSGDAVIKATIGVKTYDDAMSDDNVKSAIMPSGDEHFTNTLELDDDDDNDSLQLGTHHTTESLSLATNGDTNHVTSSLELSGDDVQGDVTDTLQLSADNDNSDLELSSISIHHVDGTGTKMLVDDHNNSI